jgi:hypothetical protein
MPILNLGDGNHVPGGLFPFSVVPHEDDIILLTRWPFPYSSEVWHWNSKDSKEALNEFHCITTTTCSNAISMLSTEFVKFYVLLFGVVYVA